MMKVGLWTFERKTTEMECHFHHILSRTHITHMICHGWCWPLSPSWSSVWQVCFLWSYYPIHTVLWEDSHCVKSTWGEGSYTSLSWGQRSYTNSLKFPAQEICLFSPLYLFIQLFIYIIWIHDSFYTLGYNKRLLYFVAPIVPALAMGVLSIALCPFDLLLSLWDGGGGGFEYCLIFWHKILQANLVHFLP